MRKLLAVAALAASTVGISAAVATPAMADGRVWKGHYTLYSDCVKEGDRILWTSPRAQTYECTAHQLGGFNLFVTY